MTSSTDQLQHRRDDANDDDDYQSPVASPAAPLAIPLAQLSSPAAMLAASAELRRRQASGESVVNLAFCQSPFPALESGVRALRQYADACHYLPTAGLEELRKLLVEFHEQYDGFEHFTPAGVAVGPGARQLAFLIMLVFDGPLFVPTPAWPAYAAQAALSGARRHWPVPGSAQTGWRLTCEALDRAARAAGCCSKPKPKLLLLCNPDNPTGQAYGRKELESLAGYLRSNAYIVVCDEVYARLHYADDEFHSLASYYPEGTVVLSGLSKWAGLGGWRLGYALFPEELTELRLAVLSAAAHTFSCAPCPAQYAAVQLLNDLHSADAYMRHSRRVLAAVGADVCRRLRACGLDVTEPRAGYCLLVDFEPVRAALGATRTGAELCERLLAELGVALLPCAGAFGRPAGELTVRLCFVDFDGRRAMAESRRVGLGAAAGAASGGRLGAAFVRRFCEPTASAVVRLAGWVRRLRGEPEEEEEVEEADDGDEDERANGGANGGANGDEDAETSTKASAVAEASAPSVKDIEDYSKDLVDDVILIAQAEWVGCRM